MSRFSQFGNDLYSGNLDWVVRPTFFVNVSAGSFMTDATTPPEFRGDAIRHIFGSSNSDAFMTQQGFPTVPAQFQQPSGYVDNIATTGTVRNQYYRHFVNGNATWFTSFKGQHTLWVYSGAEGVTRYSAPINTHTLQSLRGTAAPSRISASGISQLISGVARAPSNAGSPATGRSRRFPSGPAARASV